MYTYIQSMNNQNTKVSRYLGDVDTRNNVAF